MLRTNLLRSLLSMFLCLWLAACGGGGGGESTPTPAANAAPIAALLASGDVRVEGGQLHASLGASISLDGGTSSDPEQDALTFEWTLTAKPAASALPAGGSGRSLTWRPDVLGTYSYTLKVTDSKGASASQQVTIIVDNTAPAANIVAAVQFNPMPVQAPSQAVDVGASIVLDASASSDPDGDPVSIVFDLATRPAGSTAALTVAGRVARFSTDMQGAYAVRVQGTDPGGASFVSTYNFTAANRAPTPVVVANAAPVVLDAGSNIVLASVGYDVLLDGSGTVDPDGDPVTRAWTLASRPAGSTAALATTATASTTLSIDMLGDYVVVLTATDPRGAQSTYSTTIRANNRRPVAQVGTNATPQSLPAAAGGLLVPLGTEVTLRGDGSSDADGDPLAYAWTLVSAPAGSVSTLSTPTIANPTITVDAEGIFVFRLRVTDPAGAFSERTVSLPVGTHAPVAVVDRTQVTTLVGGAVQLSAAMSFDEDGDTLAYQWSVDARPAGSTAGAGTPAAAATSFVPDVPGTYVLAVRVSDGRAAATAFVTVRALAQVASSAALSFRPLQARYSTGLDRLVMTSATPDALRVADPFTGVIASVALPAAATSLQLSADGKLALVLHDGAFSLVDLQTLALLRTAATGGAQTDGFVTNAGLAYLIGQAGGQFSTDKVAVFNARTGDRIDQPAIAGSATFYGTQRGILAAGLKRAFFLSEGLSPGDIGFFDIGSNNLVSGSGDSPYHGDYPMMAPFYLAGDESLLFTAFGTYFRTGDLRYGGRLAGINTMLGFTHSAAAQEALALPAMPSSATSYPFPPDYPAAYKRYAGPLLLPDTDLALPLLNGAQAYGMGIFHSANGSHVVLVQTGTAAQDGVGASYHVIVR